MNPMINTILVTEKELEMERQGFRRTRRYIGDASQAADAGWYQQKLVTVNDDFTAAAVSQAAVLQPLELLRSFLARIFHLPRTRRQPASSEC